MCCVLRDTGYCVAWKQGRGSLSQNWVNQIDKESEKKKQSFKQNQNQNNHIDSTEITEFECAVYRESNALEHKVK